MKARDLIPENASLISYASEIGNELYVLAKTMTSEEFTDLVRDVMWESYDDGKVSENSYSVHEFFTGRNDFGADR